MSWKETSAMDERMRFAMAASEEGAVMSRVCAAFGVSRQTGYKWLTRYKLEGPIGLMERSRAPLRHGRMRDDDLVTAIVGLRARYGWGAKKLRHKLSELRPGIVVPAASTIGDWLARKGLTKSRRRRGGCVPHERGLSVAAEANAVWCVDFKGWFRTGDGVRCDPLTISDARSRYLLCCRAVKQPDYRHVRPVFEKAFREYGLPLAIRSDNGPPFASTAVGGLSELSLWWLKLGIVLERIEPGKPQQNGRHERMHRTLKQDTAKPPAKSVAAQQRRFDRFRDIFNNQRPHEALDFRYPAQLYRPSPRSYPCRLGEPRYDGCELRQVRSNGEIKWQGDHIFVSQVLVGEPVGIDRTEQGDWRVRYGDIELGFIDADKRRLSRRPLKKSVARGHVDNASALPTCPPAQQQL